MKTFHFVVATGLAFGLAACSEEKAEAPAKPAAESSAPAKTESAPPTKTEAAPAAPAPAKSASGSDVSDAAQQACLKAVTDQTNESNVTVTSTEFSEANSLVMVGVGDQRAPWRCLVSNDGSVQEVMFTGDDSAGVAEPSTGGDERSIAEEACLTAVANEVGVPRDQVSTIEILSAEAGFGVTVSVPDASAPWSCLSDGSGNVQGVAFTGDEGRL